MKRLVALLTTMAVAVAAHAQTYPNRPVTIRLPERCAKLTFGGPKNNRLYMASCHSLYALYVEAHGAV